MDWFVYTSTRKLLIVSSPILFLAALLTGLAFWRTDFALFAVVMDAIAIGFVAQLLPPGEPIMNLTATELRYGRGLQKAIRLRDIKYASIYNSRSSNSWPGLVSVSLNMEARRSGGQIYYDEKSFNLFCPDVPAKELHERVNRFIELAKNR